MEKIMEALYKLPDEATFNMLLLEAKVTNGDYEKAIRISTRKTTVTMKRNFESKCINNYNPVLLEALESNLDLQYITDVFACIAYITSYLCKSEKKVSDLMEAALA